MLMRCFGVLMDRAVRINVSIYVRMLVDMDHARRVMILDQTMQSVRAIAAGRKCDRWGKHTERVEQRQRGCCP